MQSRGRIHSTEIEGSVQELDNPIWAALTSRHEKFAQGDKQVLRYPKDMAPFVAIASRDAASSADLSAVVEPGERFYLVGPAPMLPASWEIEQQAVVLQMMWAGITTGVPAHHPVRVLSDRDTAAMMALTAVVFPGFFRPRTPQMGRYLGIFDGDTLIAMAGERMCTNTHQEISAVCTHPQFAGRGYARCLVTQLVNEILQRGSIPFLHVGESNAHARHLYDRMGFVMRARLPMLLVHRSA